MTDLLPVQTIGDCWNNPTEFQQQLDQYPQGVPLQLDLRIEAPCLSELGITSVINEWLTKRKMSPDQVHLYRWANPVEYVPYRRFKAHSISHFFFMVKKYWRSQPPTLDQQLRYQFPFGLFIGRISVSRAVILYQCSMCEETILTSRMRHAVPLPWQTTVEQYNAENISQWLSPQQQDHMFDCYQQGLGHSLDDKSVGDQFITPESWIETNTSLLDHYHRFAVEIVCETFVMGDTFFPTEKTLRPIMMAKPILVFGPRYFLARLRSMGFKTYHSIWDESYDLHQGPERWRLMQQSMNTLLECGRQQQHLILSQAHEIAMFNRQVLDNMSKTPIELANYDYTRV